MRVRNLCHYHFANRKECLVVGPFIVCDADPSGKLIIFRIAHRPKTLNAYVRLLRYSRSDDCVDITAPIIHQVLHHF